MKLNKFIKEITTKRTEMLEGNKKVESLSLDSVRVKLFRNSLVEDTTIVIDNRKDFGFCVITILDEESVDSCVMRRLDDLLELGFTK